MKTVAVIVPAYKPDLNNNERISFRQTVKILSGYDIILVTPEHLDVSEYSLIAADADVTIIRIIFNPEYFTGIQGYNRLLLSPVFYDAFSDYKYILICQLDAYIFRDELLMWCEKGYDYVGAPLIGKYEDTEFSKIMRVGNGGLSLRKVESYRNFFLSKANVFNAIQIAKRIDIKGKPYTRIFIWALMMLGWRNKPQSVADRWKYNEDDFWSSIISGSQYKLSIPAPMEALKFSFERFPSSLFKLNDCKLPMGCHAWEKYEYNEFWSVFVR